MVPMLKRLARLGRRLAGVDEHARIFNNHYRRGGWIGGGSGTGSTPEITSPYRDFLTRFFKENNIKSVVDLGCGDWQFSRLINWDGIDYLGIDVSGAVLKNTSKFAKPGIRFMELNGTSGKLPAADLLIAKDVLQHWTNDDIEKLIPSLSKFKFVLFTNGSHKGSDRINIPSTIGGCRPLDFTKAPFNLKGRYVFEFEADEPKITFLYVWPGSQNLP